MNEANAILLIEALGVKNAELFGDWIRASCPFAFARHKKGTDHNPSFGILHNPTGRSRFNCFGCNLKGPDLDKLVMEMQLYVLRKEAPKSVDLAKAWKLVEDENEIGYAGAEWTGITNTEQEFQPWPDWFIEGYPTVDHFPKAVAYLQSRNVPPALWKAFNLRFHPDKRMICFPFYNRDGYAAGMRGRAISPTTNFPHYDFKYNSINNTALVWLGEDTVDYLKPVVIVEGQFDRASVYRRYRNVLSNLTASLSEPKVRKLDNAVEILGLFDDDEAGKIASTILADRFGALYREISYEPVEKDRVHPDDFTDPGSCNHLQIAKMLDPYVKLDDLIE